MKKIILFGLLVFIGCMLVAGYQSGKFQFGTNSTHPAIPEETVISDTILVPTVNTPEPSLGEVLQEHMEVSIGNYRAELPVFVDNITVGTVSPGTPLDISVDEGHHVVKVCDGSACVQADVQVTSGIKTVIDFGERLAQDVPKGTLSVSIGSYLAAGLPVFIDNLTAGEVSSGKPLNMTVSEGRHSVRVCLGTVCEDESVAIQSARLSLVDFGERLVQDVPKGTLSVSTGGYTAVDLPVFIDNISAGEVSFARPLKLMVSEGRHTVTVCSGLVCENESVGIKFAQTSFVDFGERLKKDAEFTKPTVRIASSLLSGTTYTVNVEFINPDTADHTLTAVIGSGYSYIDSVSEPRRNDFAKTPVSQFVKAGGRQMQQVTLYLTKGSFPIASEPTVADVTVE
jgi:hypothetical protein